MKLYFIKNTAFLLLLFVLILVTPGLASSIIGDPANGSLNGQVTDAKTKKPLSGATILIPDLKLGVATDALGKFEFKNLPLGTFLLEIKFEGYKSVSKSIVLTGSARENFQLEESAAEISEVVVTGSSKATQIKRNPVPIVSCYKLEYKCY